MPAAPPQTTPAWQKCVAAFSAQHIERLATWRGYSVEFCHKLKESLLIGVFHERIAFPITDPQGEVVGCHHRPLGRDGQWFVTSFKRTKVTMLPYIVNVPQTKGVVTVFESQWDALAWLDKADWHGGGIDEIGCIATRGASNGKRIMDYCRPGATILAFGQNDEAGRKWLSRVVKVAKGEVRQVAIPAGKKDLNDWIRDGATVEELQTAILDGTVLKTAAEAAQDDSQETEADSAEDQAYEGTKPLETTKDGRIWVLLPP